MNEAVPSSRLREKLGVEVLEDLGIWVKGIVRSEGISRDEYREILSRLDGLDRGYEGLKEEVYRLRGEMNARFQGIEARFQGMNERLDRMNERMLSMIKWTVGTIALFGTILSVLMAVFKFLG